MQIEFGNCLWENEFLKFWFFFEKVLKTKQRNFYCPEIRSLSAFKGVRLSVIAFCFCTSCASAIFNHKFIKNIFLPFFFEFFMFCNKISASFFSKKFSVNNKKLKMKFSRGKFSHFHQDIDTDVSCQATFSPINMSIYVFHDATNRSSSHERRESFSNICIYIKSI